MRGIFVFYTLRDLVFYEYDDELWQTIAENSPTQSSEWPHKTTSYEVERESSGDWSDKYSSQAAGNILQFFAAVLASQMFFTADLDQGISEMECEKGRKLSIALVLNCTVILITSDQSACTTECLMEAFKSIMRIFPATFIRREDEGHVTDWNVVTFLRTVFNELADSSVENVPFSSGAEQHLMLPSAMQNQLQMTLRRVCGLSAFRNAVEQAFLICDGHTVSHFSRSSFPAFDAADSRLIPLIIKSLDLIPFDGSMFCTDEYDNLNKEILMGSVASSKKSSLLESSHSVFSSTSSSSAASTADLCELEKTLTYGVPIEPDILQTVLLLRHPRGGVRPYSATVAAVSENCRLLLFGPARSEAVVPYIYDGLHLLIKLQSQLRTPAFSSPQFREAIVDLSQVMERLFRAAEQEKLSRTKRKTIHDLVKCFKQINLEELLSVHRKPSNRNFSSLSRTARSLIQSCITVSEKLLLAFVDERTSKVPDHQEQKWIAAVRKAQALAKFTLKDYEGFLRMRTGSPTVQVTSIIPPNCSSPPMYVVFINRVTNKCLIAASDELEQVLTTTSMKGPLALRDVPLALRDVPLALRAVPLALRDVPLALHDVSLTLPAVPLALRDVPLALPAVPLALRDVLTPRWHSRPEGILSLDCAYRIMTCLSRFRQQKEVKFDCDLFAIYRRQEDVGDNNDLLTMQATIARICLNLTRDPTEKTENCAALLKRLCGPLFD
ncbi:hypothetical protein BV898_00487 [Hypsibius exemplaris]|uniref:Uncharacterized protein n=1 Tax=Hypsibius exemplaris TaxID=2072580 RepID=A0A1W0XDJ8_HYPEX|nr:hypothetical protein BV898_00487 [Hypsibius exemplaris]